MNTIDAIATLKVTGGDAFDFLQGQLSNDLTLLKDEAEILAACCNPKGRVIWFGAVRNTEGGYELSVPADLARKIVDRLTMYRFRAKVDFDIVDEGKTVDIARHIEDGRAFIGSEQSEQFTPHMLNLDRLGAISLDKGCYTGQEIVARTHYKGATKRRTMRFQSTLPIAVGNKVQLDGRDIGEVLNASGNELLAVVPVAKSKEDIRAGDSVLQLLELPYGL